MSEAQLGIDANTARSVIERLQESEVVFNIFSILFVTAVGLWATSGFLRDAINRLVHHLTRTTGVADP